MESSSPGGGGGGILLGDLPGGYLMGAINRGNSPGGGGNGSGGYFMEGNSPGEILPAAIFRIPFLHNVVSLPKFLLNERNRMICITCCLDRMEILSLGYVFMKLVISCYSYSVKKETD